MVRFKVAYAVLFLLLLFFPLPTAATTAPGDELRQSVMALNRARHRAVHDLAQKTQAAALEEHEQQDYEKFILFLTVRIGEYCQQLLTDYGEAAQEGLPCPDANQIMFRGRSGQARTSQEQVTELEKLLAESLGQFDEELLKEDERIARRQPKERVSGYGHASSGNGTSGGAGGSGTISGGAAGQDSGSGQSADAGSMSGSQRERGETGRADSGNATGGSASGTGEGPGATGEVGTRETGGEQADGETAQSSKRELETGYDDIVARQLREAAEKETDPELKKKLWEEYYKYKEGS